MATGLETRVKKLEDVGGGGECPRCSGVVAVTMNDEFSSASKDGEPMSEEEYEAFEAEEDGEGRCPVCGEKPENITVGWPS